MKAVALIMLAVFLYVDKPVSTLQFDLDTPGSVTVVQGVDKQISTNRMSNGKLRVIVFGLNVSTFSGKFATVDGEVVSISNVVGSNPDATNANCKVTKLSKPKGLQLGVKK